MEKNKILDLRSIDDYNKFLGLETKNPLVGIIDFSKVKVLRHRRKCGTFYAIFLKEKIHGQLVYGRGKYDYQEGTLVFVAPGQVAGIDDGGETKNPQGYALVFHPDLLRGTPLARRMKDYTFFSYEVNEALHMSEKEKATVKNCFAEIAAELDNTIDRHSRSIIAANIEVLLNNCMRFYDRQFVTREPVNRDVLARFEKLLDDYFDSDKPRRIGLPSVAYCADQLHFSPNYFGDLIKKETGRSAIEHIHLSVIERVKQYLMDTDMTVSEIAYAVGFQYPHHLSRMFKKIVGCNPREYRRE